MREQLEIDEQLEIERDDAVTDRGAQWTQFSDQPAAARTTSNAAAPPSASHSSRRTLERRPHRPRCPPVTPPLSMLGEAAGVAEASVASAVSLGCGGTDGHGAGLDTIRGAALGVGTSCKTGGTGVGTGAVLGRDAGVWPDGGRLKLPTGGVVITGC